MPLATTPEIVAELKAGRMVVLVDEEDRENEGDLVIAAEFVTPDAINFMARHARGLVCLTLTEERCRQLGAAADGRRPTAPGTGTNFTVSIEAAEGVTTGISAADRARTVRAAVAPDAKPGDLVQPGHIFPVMAQPGGVLVRAGHTEAGCDLARLAGLTPAAVICEIMKDDGTMARMPDLDRLRRSSTASRSARSPTSSITAAAPSASSSASPSVRSTRRTARSGWSSIATRSPMRRTWRWCAARSRPTPRRWCACTSRCR